MRKWLNPSKTRTYYSWRSMRARCYNPKSDSYLNYGGRENPITVCDRWRNDYDIFVADLGICPEGYTIERRDNNGNYEPSNCHWIPKAEQARNKTTNRWFTYAGKTQLLFDWSKELGIENSILRRRLKRGIPLEQVFQKESLRNLAKHGSATMYDRHGCRCSLCREAERVYRVERRAQHRKLKYDL